MATEAVVTAIQLEASPAVVNRHDPEAEVMEEAADPIMVIEALEENLAEELTSSTEAEKLS